MEGWVDVRATRDMSDEPKIRCLAAQGDVYEFKRYISMSCSRERQIVKHKIIKSFNIIYIHNITTESLQRLWSCRLM